MNTTELLFWGLVFQGVGDYVTQSDWMATRKVRRDGETRARCAEGWAAAVSHGTVYTLPFLLLTTDPLPLLVIGGTHVLIDRFRLARHVVWARNQVCPATHRRPWADCRATGFPPEMPAWQATWLMVMVDNVMHVLINSLTLVFLVGGR